MTLDPLALQADFLATERGLDLLEERPLEHLRVNRVQGLFLDNLHARVYLHAANKFGKSTIGVAADIAFAQGCTHLAGRALPYVPAPCKWGLFVTDYKIHKLSTQPIFARLLGSWPHRPMYEGDTLTAIYVKPGHGEGYRLADDPGDDWRKWSVIGIYSTKNLNSGTGFRLHGAHFDEPAPERIFNEVLKAGFPGYVMPFYVTATAVKRSQWYPMRAHFPLSCEGVVENGAIRLRGSVYDNRREDGGFLSAADIADLEQRYAGMPEAERQARLYGFEMNEEGSSPFRAHMDELGRWLSDASPGITGQWTVTREIVTPKGKELAEESVDVEVWEKYDRAHEYRVIADCSLGIDDGEHDPGEAIVVDMTTGWQAAGYHGFLGEYGLAVLCAGLSKRYGDCLVDPDTTGGYGSAFLTGLRDAGCTRVSTRAPSVPERGLKPSDIGYVVSSQTRPHWAASLNEALIWSEQGKPWLRIRSRRDIAELMDLTMRDGKIVTKGGLHDEAFSVWGRAASLLTPERERRQRTEREQMVSPRENYRRQALIEAGFTGGVSRTRFGLRAGLRGGC